MTSDSDLVSIAANGEEPPPRESILVLITRALITAVTLTPSDPNAGPLDAVGRGRPPRRGRTTPAIIARVAITVLTFAYVLTMMIVFKVSLLWALVALVLPVLVSGLLIKRFMR